MKNIELYNFIKENISILSNIPIDNRKDRDHFQEDLELDSLQAIEIVNRVEKKYKIKIDSVELEELQSLDSIYNACINLIK
jgi:acyl carrier protein